jgi:hypothetical protein
MVVAASVALLGVVYVAKARPWQTARLTGVTETGVLTVTAVRFGRVALTGSGSFEYEVRLPDGAEGTIKVGDALAPGAKLRATFSRTTGRELVVLAYRRCADDCR